MIVHVHCHLCTFEERNVPEHAVCLTASNTNRPCIGLHTFCSVYLPLIRPENGIHLGSQFDKLGNGCSATFILHLPQNFVVCIGVDGVILREIAGITACGSTHVIINVIG